VCIGRDIEPEAANTLLDACLLTAEEMATGKESWLTLPDPFKASWDAAMREAGHSHAHQHAHEHGHGDERAEQLANELLKGGSTEANLKGVVDLAKDHGVPTDNLIGFVFDSILDEDALKQIKECSTVLRGLYEASPDKRKTQWAILGGVATLVTAPKHGDALLKQTPAILMALYDIDLVEEGVVAKWYAQALSPNDAAGRMVREAAAPFIEWLERAEEEDSADELDKATLAAVEEMALEEAA